MLISGRKKGGPEFGFLLTKTEVLARDLPRSGMEIYVHFIFFGVWLEICREAAWKFMFILSFGFMNFCVLDISFPVTKLHKRFDLLAYYLIEHFTC